MKSNEEKFKSAGFMNEKPVTEIVFATGFFSISAFFIYLYMKTSFLFLKKSI